ncbi:MAG: hypothetical protein BGO39_20205 [Chloroflexi bacterium 54-19]|nr:MAG: hypothetical protein BGO39_20205 [Chloroflexi bacterium 54-19]
MRSKTEWSRIIHHSGEESSINNEIFKILHKSVLFLIGRGQKAEGRGQKAEGRRQRAEGREQYIVAAGMSEGEEPRFLACMTVLWPNGLETPTGTTFGCRCAQNDSRGFGMT